jgi:hypothetical protein
MPGIGKREQKTGLFAPVVLQDKNEETRFQGTVSAKVHATSHSKRPN